MDLKFYTHFPQSPQLDLLACRGSIRLERYSWQAVGGPHSAVMWMDVRPADLLAVPRLLGAPVEMWGPRLERVWWGYVHAVELYNSRYSLDGLYNRVAARFRQGQFTEWVEDAASMRTYGVKEKVLDVPNSTLSAAEGIRDAFLAEHAWPSAELKLEIDAGNSTEMRIEARGWYHTLGWHYLQMDMSVAATGGGQADSWAAVGDGFSRRKLAQSLTIPAGETWTLRRLSLLLKRTGEPGDRLLARLHTDQGGSPGECLATGFVEAAEVNTAGGWMSADFDSPVEVAGGAYWLVVNRSGGTDSGNYVTIGEQNGGTYQVYDGSSWSGQSGTLAGEVLGGEHHPGNEILQAAYACGSAFLTGLGYSSPQPPLVPLGTLPDYEMYFDGANTALQVLDEVLAAGSTGSGRLLARVNERRKLHVYPHPQAESTTLRVENGSFYDGTQHMRPWELSRLVGRWVSTVCGDVFVVDREYWVSD